MNIIIQSTIHTLKKSKILLSSLSNKDLSNNSISPYYSSIGSHLRHILDFYDCVLIDDYNEVIDLTARKRNKNVESNCNEAHCYLDRLLHQIEHLDAHIDINKTVCVIDDLGLGKTEITYTFSALLAQANSHTIHHYAIINYILDALGITIEDDTFGYNPTTPKPILNFD